MSVHDIGVGLQKHEINTPALLVDLPILETNLNKMAAFFSDWDVKLRPHADTYNASPVFAHMKLQGGAICVTSARLSEAEILADAGNKDILIENQVVGRRKIERLANFAKVPDTKEAVDC